MDVPIVLEQFFYEKLNIGWRNGVSEDSIPMELNFSFDVRTQKDDNHQTRLTLGIEMKPVASFQGIEISASIDGYFTINTGCNEDERKFYSLVNAAIILYGILRGHISLVTANFPNGSFLLPTVMMQSEIEKFLARKTQVKPKAKRSSTKSILKRN